MTLDTPPDLSVRPYLYRDPFRLMTLNQALYLCKDPQRHYSSCTVLTIATTHIASVVCFVLALALLPAYTRRRRARHTA